MKKRISQFLLVVMVLGLCMNNIPFSVKAATQAVSVVRNTDTTTVHPGEEEIEVTLDVTGSPDTTYIQDSDIMLVIDKSGSMGESGYFDMMTPTKEAAKEFVDAVNFDHHQVGVVDFSDLTRTKLLNLSQDSDNIKNHIDTIVAKGGTYTDNAINLAKNELLNNGRPDSQKVIILLTDGAANNTNAALRAAEEAKEAGIVFYTIAALSEGTNVENSAPNKLLVQMATTGVHHHFVLGAVGIDEVYKKIAKEIGVSAAYNVSITETVSDQFEIVAGSYNSTIPQPTVKDNTLVWNMNEVKDTTFQVKYKVKAKADTAAGTYNISSGSTIQYYDYVGKEFNYTIKNNSVKVINYAPIISSTSIDKANITGGESITIKGKNFMEGATVKIGSKLATDVVVVDSNTITATVPVGNQGNTKIIVTNLDKQSASCDFYYYGDVIVSSISPVTGPFAGGKSVSISGANFMSDVKVYFGDQEAQSTTYYNSTYISVKTPKAIEAGAVDVRIANGDGTEIVLKDAYTYEEEIVKKLEITSLGVTSTTVDSTVKTHIYGDNIVEGCKVYFGDQEAVVQTYYNKQDIVVQVPASSEKGFVDVKIENPDGATATLENAFEYYKEEDIVLPAPEITSISATTDTVNGGTSIYIEGLNFQKDLTVTFGNEEGIVSTYYSAKKIRVKVPAGEEGIASITVTNPDGQSFTLDDCFEYVALPPDPAPEITLLSSDTDTEVGGSSINIEGLNFKSGLTVMFGDEEATVLNYYSAKKIRVKVPANEVGVVSITITNPDGQSYEMKDAFTYTLLTPAITSINITSAEMTGGVNAIIYGSKFDSSCKVYFGDVEANVTSVTSSNIRVVVPAVTKWGTVDVRVVRASGAEGILENGFTYNEPAPTPVPVIDYLSTKGTAASKITECLPDDSIYINGTRFNVVDTMVNIYDADDQLIETLKPLNRYSTTKLRFRVPKKLAAGEYKITVSNIADGTESDGVMLTVK